MTAAPKITPAFDVEVARRDFAILARPVYGKRLAYLDSGASAQKPVQVLDAMRVFAESEYANVHRGVHFLSAAATDRYEAARRTVQKFLGAASDYFRAEHPANSLQMAFYTLVPFYVLAVLTFLWLARALKREPRIGGAS